MKKMRILLVNFIIGFSFGILLFGCAKEEEKTSPNFVFSSPLDGQEIQQGQTVVISVETENNDANINLVRIYLDDKLVHNLYAYPFEYFWDTYETDTGRHIIKAIILDNENYSVSTQISVYLIEGDEGSLYDIRDGQFYKSVKIGEQWWMAENLNYKTSNNSWLYQNTPNNGSKYGRLYNWLIADTICPCGWHLPSDGEWKQLEMAIGMSEVDANDAGWRGSDESLKLKASNGWEFNGNGTDEYKFSALPGGCRNSETIFFDEGSSAYFWTSTSSTGSFVNYKIYRRLNHSLNTIYRAHEWYDFGFSIRCVRD